MYSQNRVAISWSFIFTFILLCQKSSCLDPYYQECEPKVCRNGLNISFPFYIPKQQSSFCGYPGYEVNCSKQGDAILSLLGVDYYILDQIFYNNRTCRVYNAALSSSSNRSSCLPEIRNYTLLNQLKKISLNPLSDLYLFSNCNKSLPEELSRYKVGCDGLVILAKDKYSDYAIKECKSMVVAPVALQETDGSIGAENYKELLRRGFLLDWQTSTDCRACARSGGRCGFDSSVYRYKCFCPDGSRPWSCDQSRKNKPNIILITAVSAGGIALLVILVFNCGRKFSKFWKCETEENKDLETFLKNCESLAPKRYCYSEVKKITNSFSTKLGQGGYGSVYKGNLKDGSPVAVKVLKESKGNGEEFINELASISRTSHVNIVTLIGFSVQGKKRALIYEFMANGSLEKFIYREQTSVNHQLEWPTSYRVAVGIARGLEYLHRGCNTRILHFDIKPHNILLDENFSPKISDFGLAKLCTRKESMISTMAARGTIGYIAPEVVCKNIGVVSPKSDVYSYGMMVLEMVGGRKNADVGVDGSSEIYFPDWIYTRFCHGEELGLSGIKDEKENEQARKMLLVSLWCIQTNPLDRPSMSKVVEMLEGNLEALEMPPKPFLYPSPPASSKGSTTQSRHSAPTSLSAS